MIYKLRKFQSGGGAAPFTYYTPVTVNTTQQTVSQSTSTRESSPSNEDKGKLTDKDFMSMLKEIDGLPSDMNAIFSNLEDLYAESSLPGLDTGNINTKYIRTLHSMKNAIFNKKEYDQVYNQAIKNNTLSEVAITDRGQVVVFNNGKITTKSIDSLTDKDSVMTNQDLLAYRARYSPMDNSILNIVQSGVSMDMVNKYIQNISSKLGTSELNQSNYSNSQIKEVSEGLELLQKAFKQDTTIEGLFKNNQITKTQLQQAKSALNYIYKTMPTNMKALLEIKGGSKEGSISLIQDALNLKMDSYLKTDSNMLLDSEGHKLGKDGNKSASSGDKYKQSISSQFYSGYGAKSEFILNGGTSYAIHAQVNTLPLVTKSGEPLGRTTLDKVTQSQQKGLFNLNNASMNGEFISPSQFQNIIIDDGDVHSIDLPLDIEAKQQGLIKPDLKISQKLEQLNSYLNSNPTDDFTKINELCKQFGLPLKYNPDGEVNYTAWGRFAVLNATASSKAFKEDPVFSNQLTEVTDDNELDGYISILKANNKDDKDYKFDKLSWWDQHSPIFNSHDALYKGTLYIPMYNNEFNANAGSGQDIFPNEALSIEAKEQQKERLSTFNNAGGFNL